jgi:hypothetical protein
VAGGRVGNVGNRRLSAKTGRSGSDPIEVIATVLHFRGMVSRGFMLAIFAALVAVAAIWWTQDRSLNPEERLLFKKLDAAILHEPPRADDIIDAFDLPEECREKTCFPEAGKIGNLRYSRTSLRQPEEGIIFVIGDFTDACVRADRVKSYFGTRAPAQSCFDAECWYADAQRSWGILTFKLDRPDSQCVSSAVINSLPEHRPKP